MAEDKKKKYGKGYVSGLRKSGESFMDFTNRRHEELYPGHRAAAKAAGASGLQAFGGKHRAFVDANRAQMPWLQQGQRYKSADWQRMLANQRGGMYGGTAGQVGGAPPGRPPLPTAMGNILGRGQRPAIAPLQRKTAYMADPRNQAAAAAAQIRQTGGDASVAEDMYSSPWAIGQRRDFPEVVPPRFSRSYQEDMGTGRFAPTQQGAHRRLPFNPMTGQMGNFGRNNILYPGMQREGTPRGAQYPNTPPPGLGTQQLSMADLARMQQQAGASRPSTPYPGQNYGQTGAFLGQFPRYPASPAGSQLPYNVLDQQRRRNLAGYPMNQETTSSIRGNSPWYWGPPRRPRVAGQQY